MLFVTLLKYFFMRYLSFCLLIVTVLLSASCNDKDKTRKSVLGSWNCNEFPEITTPRDYMVNIERNNYLPNDTNQYFIRNFFNLGHDDQNIVYFEQLTDTTLIIHTQITESGVWVNGTGKITGIYERIEWEYSINKTYKENVRAVYY